LNNTKANASSNNIAINLIIYADKDHNHDNNANKRCDNGINYFVFIYNHGEGNHLNNNDCNHYHLYDNNNINVHECDFNNYDNSYNSINYHNNDICVHYKYDSIINYCCDNMMKVTKSINKIDVITRIDKQSLLIMDSHEKEIHLDEIGINVMYSDITINVNLNSNEVGRYKGMNWNKFNE